MICPHCKKAIRTIKCTDAALRGRVLRLRAEGYSLRDIQSLTGVSFATVSRWIKKWGRK